MHQHSQPDTLTGDHTTLNLLWRQAILQRSRDSNSKDQETGQDVNQKLARARLEDIRRDRNQQIRQRQATTLTASSSSSLSAHAKPTLSTTPGIAFLSSHSLKQRETQDRIRFTELKRQVAGPIPPESWISDFEALRAARDPSQVRFVQGSPRFRNQPPIDPCIHSEQQRPSAAGPTQNDLKAVLQRKRDCASFRYFLDHHTSTNPLRAGARPQDEFQHSKVRLRSLQDLVLCKMVEGLSAQPKTTANPKRKQKNKQDDVEQRWFDQFETRMYKEALQYLPPHIRARMLALGGRIAATCIPTSFSALDSILHCGDLKADSPDRQQHDGSPRNACDEASSIDDWEADADSNENQHSSYSMEVCEVLDLSHAALSSKAIKRLLLAPTPSNQFNTINLRILSLVGWNRYKNSNKQDGTDACDSLVSVLGQLVNLEFLSLAASELGYRDVNVQDQSAIGNASIFMRQDKSQIDKASIFMRKLSRTTPRLKILDVSCCQWLTALSIVAISWTTIWPRLDHLSLFLCPEFTKASVWALKSRDLSIPCHTTDSLATFPTQQFRGERAKTFACNWHSLHYDRLKKRPKNDDPQNHDHGHHNNNNHNNRNSSSIVSYSRGDLEPPHLATNHLPEPALILQCPKSQETTESYIWNRARVLDAVRGRLAQDHQESTEQQPQSVSDRRWIDVWF